MLPQAVAFESLRQRPLGCYGYFCANIRIVAVAIVYIPPQLREFTGGDEKVTVPGATLRQVISNLGAKCPGLTERLLVDGEISPAIAVAVDGDLTRLGLLQPLQENSEIHFLPAIAGG